MAATLDLIADISRSVALELGRGLDVATVAATGDGSGRAEVLVTITGCHQAPCRFLINVSRADGAEFEREFRSKLQDALQRHSHASP
jgi:hypothetical protein